MATSDKRELLLRVKVDDDASRPLKNIGDAADDTKDELQGMNVGLKKLDDQMAEATKTVAGLRKEIAQTGDLELVKDLSKQEARLKQFARQRKLLLGDVLPDLGPSGADGAEKFSRGFAARIGPLMAKAPMTPALVGGVAVAAPFVANVLAGAVVGGIATGVAGVGVAIAAKDAEVQAAAKSLGDEIGATLKNAAQPFVPATIKAIGIVRAEFRDMDDDLEGIFDSAAGYVEPLTRAATGFVREMVPGIRDAVDKAEPFFTMLGDELPELGADVGELFSTMADHAQDGADAVGQMLDLMGGVADATGTVIDGLALVKKLGDFDPAGEPGTHWADQYFGNLEKKFIPIKPAADPAAAGVKRVADAAAELEVKAMAAAGSVDALREAVSRGLSKNLDARQAQRDLEQAIDDGSAALAENGQTAINHGAALDINSAKGRANAAALDGIASGANDAYDAILEQTGSQELANAASDRGRAKFLELAGKMGLSKEAAIRLADSLLRIKDRRVTVTANTGPALAAASALQARINNMSARINVYAEPSGGFGGGAHTGFGNSTGIADGGPIYGSGPKGVDSVPAVLAPGEHVLTAKEVDAAGGHRKVEAWRKSLLSRASSSAMGAAGTGGGGQRVEVVLKLDGSDRGIVGAFLEAIRDMGGNPRVLGIGGNW